MPEADGEIIVGKLMVHWRLLVANCQIKEGLPEFYEAKERSTLYI